MRRIGHKLPQDIKERLKYVQKILTSHPQIVFAYLFGGLARDRHTPLSDVDIAVYLKTNTDFVPVILELNGQITQATGTDAVDIIILNNAPLSVAGRIQQSFQMLTDKDPHFRYEYESLTRRKFFDFEKLEKEILYRRFGLDR